MTHVLSRGSDATGSWSPHAATGHTYSIFGGVLHSELEFPELIGAADRVPDWSLRIEHGPPAPNDAMLVGQRRAGSESYRLMRTSDGLRLEYSHAGTFDITGSTITWFPGPDRNAELARAIVTGPVMALVLEAAGCLCLHGSGVAIGDSGLAFLAPKYHGKSTLSVALASAGASFIGDDTLAVTAETPPRLRPGTGSARLWGDTARALRLETLSETVIPGVKTTAALTTPLVRRSRSVLATVYVLDPRAANDESAPPVSRTRMTGPAAAVALAHHAKLPDTLIGFAAAGRHLVAAAALARQVPVYSLHLARGFDVLPRVVEQIMGWHSERPGAVEADR